MKTITFIGVGNMASAIINGMGSLPVRLVLFNRTAAKCEKFRSPNTVIATSAAEAVKMADVVFLAVKPQNYREVLSTVREGLADETEILTRKLFVSIAAGITTDTVEAMLGCQTAVIRAMPNTPLQIGRGVTALCKNPRVSDEDFALVSSIFGGAGMVFTLDEDKMNTIVCVNGSSPAYFYHFIQAMTDSAKAQGLSDMDEKVLQEAVCRSIIGAAELLLASGKSASELIREVTSPKGTTERAMNVLYDNHVAATIDEAMRACTLRATELSDAFRVKPEKE